MLTDVYSTAFQLTAESRTYTLGRLVEHGEKELTVREILETGMLAAGGVGLPPDGDRSAPSTQSRTGRRVTLTAEANVTVLLPHGGRRPHLSTITRQLQAACPLELPEEASCSCHCGQCLPSLSLPPRRRVALRCASRWVSGTRP
ncbi:MAG: hypothetical protein ACLRWQ_12460 [Flavonifractor plautii]